ncbi:hypothetical protein RCL1_003907 [Eukaryota sp. TZLM3-RCL]
MTYSDEEFEPYEPDFDSFSEGEVEPPSAKSALQLLIDQENDQVKKQTSPTVGSQKPIFQVEEQVKISFSTQPKPTLSKSKKQDLLLLTIPLSTSASPSISLPNSVTGLGIQSAPITNDVSFNTKPTQVHVSTAAQVGLFECDVGAILEYDSDSNETIELKPITSSIKNNGPCFSNFSAFLNRISAPLSAILTRNSCTSRPRTSLTNQIELVATFERITSSNICLQSNLIVSSVYLTKNSSSNPFSIKIPSDCRYFELVTSSRNYFGEIFIIGATTSSSVFSYSLSLSNGSSLTSLGSFDSEMFSLSLENDCVGFVVLPQISKEVIEFATLSKSGVLGMFSLTLDTSSFAGSIKNLLILSCFPVPTVVSSSSLNRPLISHQSATCLSACSSFSKNIVYLVGTSSHIQTVLLPSIIEPNIPSSFSFSHAVSLQVSPFYRDVFVAVNDHSVALFHLNCSRPKFLYSFCFNNESSSLACNVISCSWSPINPALLAVTCGRRFMIFDFLSGNFQFFPKSSILLDQVITQVFWHFDCFVLVLENNIVKLPLPDFAINQSSKADVDLCLSIIEEMPPLLDI